MPIDPSMPFGAIRYFSPEGSRLPRGWRDKLIARQAEIGGFVIAGAAVDFADYQNRIGRWAGIQEAIEICDQLEKDEGN